MAAVAVAGAAGASAAFADAAATPTTVVAIVVGDAAAEAGLDEGPTPPFPLGEGLGTTSMTGPPAASTGAENAPPTPPAEEALEKNVPPLGGPLSVSGAPRGASSPEGAGRRNAASRAASVATAASSLSSSSSSSSPSSSLSPSSSVFFVIPSIGRRSARSSAGSSRK